MYSVHVVKSFRYNKNKPSNWSHQKDPISYDYQEVEDASTYPYFSPPGHSEM